MPMVSDFRLLAHYNAWMNERIYEAAALPRADAAAPRGAYFESLLGTLNHIVVADIIWLKRFAAHPNAAYQALDIVRRLATPPALSHLLSSDLAHLAELRKALDHAISAWTEEMTDTDLDRPLSYVSMSGIASTRNFGSLVLHFFNHQTHHRGQATTLLIQAGIDMGPTDLLLCIPEIVET